MNTIENLLDNDLNYVISKAIAEKIANLESQIENCHELLEKANAENRQLKKDAKLAAIANGMIEAIRAKYQAVKLVKATSSSHEISVWHGRYIIIRDVIKAIYGDSLPETFAGFREDFYSIVWNCKDHKDRVCSILEMIGGNENAGLIESIRRFRMPHEFTKAEIISFIKKPHYGYNGGRFNAIGNWIGERFAMGYTPYDLLFQNKHIVSDDCFAMVLDAITLKVEYSEDFFGIPLHNSGATDEQIKALGTLAAVMPLKGARNDTQQGKFIEKFLHKFNKEDIEILFERIQLTSMDWSALHYGIFPVEYQMRAFRRMSFKDLKGMIGSYTGRFSDGQIESIYADWFIHNPHPDTPRNTSV